ncbi:MAG: CHASE2 domain-containing protein [Candidatus Omnitrophica bacterium]|nr:CHASE2 domain-containing protein [Candidatus Omnitrophota bacterium]MDD5653774.1 CHASE2 domain-containing protein [Candidatus Omnitrophota bacterium]
MKETSDYYKFLFLGIFSLVAAFFSHLIIPPKFSQPINDLSSWYIYSISHKSSRPIKIVAVAIDEYSLGKVHQRWPWKRSLYAQLLKTLDQEHVNTVGLDFVFMGESEDDNDDIALKDALINASEKIVLPFFFDPKKAVPVYPAPELKDHAFALGMLNTPIDPDGKTRRLRAFIGLDEVNYYSFSVALSAAFLKQKPDEIAARIPLASDNTFLINFLAKQKDFTTVSFYDVLNNLPELKQRLGSDFLDGSLVLVYPQAEILHDTYATAFGKVPGGILHLNGVVDIVSGKLIKEIDFLAIPFLVFTFLVIFYVLRYTGFIGGLLFTLGTLVLNFWGLVLLTLNGIRFDFSYLTIFCAFFFILGSLYKYVSFLTQMLTIKNKATIDPLRNLFTQRYFYYRLGIEKNKIYFGKELYLVFISLGAFNHPQEEITLEKTKIIWQRVSAQLRKYGIFWSVYSPDDVVGCIVCAQKEITAQIESLRNNLGGVFSRSNIKADVRLGAVKFKKNYSLREMLFVLSGELKGQEAKAVLFRDEELAHLFEAGAVKLPPEGKFLDSLDEDIDDKNRQLLQLIENLNKEYARSKGVFFQIIASLVNALEARDSYTEGHSERVSKYALLLAEKLGWPAEEKEKLRKAGLLHDLGKIGIPDKILHKRSQLDESEFEAIRKHGTIGVKILEPLKDMSDILPWILYHHEKWNGTGYPHGLAGEAIPQGAQIIALADVFDALTTGRDYKEAYTFDVAIQAILKEKGTHFNPQLVDLFVEIIKSLQKKIHKNI